MARLKVSLIIFFFFLFLSLNTYFRTDIHSKPLHVLQGMVDATLTSWLGNTPTAVLLFVLAVGIPLYTMQKGYEARAQLTLNSTKSALKGRVYQPTATELEAAKKPVFGKQ
ncbi:MAG: hypothetical protein AAF720_02900 [Pseudomonadota bacterium]